MAKLPQLEVRVAFRELSRVYHPDKRVGAEGGEGRGRMARTGMRMDGWSSGLRRLCFLKDFFWGEKFLRKHTHSLYDRILIYIF